MWHIIYQSDSLHHLKKFTIIPKKLKTYFKVLEWHKPFHKIFDLIGRKDGTNNNDTNYCIFVTFSDVKILPKLLLMTLSLKKHHSLIGQKDF